MSIDNIARGLAAGLVRDFGASAQTIAGSYVMARDASGTGGRMLVRDLVGTGSIADMMRSLRTGTSYSLCVVGDSTGNETNEWVYRLGEAIGAALPSIRVRYALVTSYEYKDFTAVQDVGEEPHLRIGPASGYGRYWPPASVEHAAGDITIDVKASLDDWTPAAANRLASRWAGAGDRGWDMYVGTDGKLNFAWSTDGTTYVVATSTNPLGFTDGSTHWCRATLDVDNGAGGYAWRLEVSDDYETWTLVGSASTAAGSTTVHQSTDNVSIGAQHGTVGVMSGKIYQVRIKNAYYNVVSPMVNPQSVSSLSRYSTGDVTSLGGAPTLTIWNGSVSGAGLAQWTDAATLAKALPITCPSLVIGSSSHNDALDYGSAWLTKLDTWLTNIRARNSYAGVAMLLQNPRKSPALLEEHVKRIAFMPLWAGKNSVDTIDGWSAFFDASGQMISDYIASDGVHPDTAVDAETGLTGREALSRAVSTRFLQFA